MGPPGGGGREGVQEGTRVTNKDIINTIDNYNGLLKSTTEGKNYTYDINGEKYIIYIKENKKEYKQILKKYD